MISKSLEFYNEIFREILDSDFIYVSLFIAKAFAIVAILLQYFKLYFKTYSLESSRKHILSFYDIFRPLVLILLIASYTYFFDMISNLAVKAETYVIGEFEKKDRELLTLNEELKAYNKPQENIEQSAQDKFMENVSKASHYILHPSLIIAETVKFICKLIDWIIFDIVILIRFAMLFILRFLGPLAIVASVYDRFQNYFWNWLKGFGLLYLWVFAIFIVNIFAAFVGNKVLAYKRIPMMPDAAVDMSFISVLVIMVIVKIILYFQSRKILFKIFN
ncbi:MAG: hypothetical protein R6W78_01210 [Bacteroidales bacterium]